MVKVALTKRNYAGPWYCHVFKNDITGEMAETEGTHEEYKRMGEKGGSKFNPTLAGHTWVYSFSGVAVDTLDKRLGENEYFETPEGMIQVRLSGNDFRRVDKTAITEDSIEI